jgi:predicted cupin superfamily sugar epimerase
MHARAAELVSSLRLVPHPEGGFFREIHRSSGTVFPADGRPERSALTAIHFLLVDGEVSHWHRVASDEVWHFLEGEPLELLVADSRFTRVDAYVLGASNGGGAEPVRVVPAGSWQAARTSGAYTLVAAPSVQGSISRISRCCATAQPTRSGCARATLDPCG